MNIQRFVDHPVKVIMFFLAFILVGTLSYRRLPLNMFPNLQTPRITVSIATKGLTPEEAERRLTVNVERQMSSIRGVASITSYSREENVVLNVDFHWGTDMEFAYLDVKKNLGSFETDENVTGIDVYRFDPNAGALMTLAFTGDVDRVNLTSFVENSLKPRLETVKGVAYVKTNGGSTQQVEMRVNPDLMSQYKVTPAELVAAIQSYNISQTGGVIVEGNVEMTLKFISRFKNVDEIGHCVVKVVDNNPLHLEDLGTISIGETEDRVRVHQDGQTTLSLDVFREPDANAVETARGVRAMVNEINARGGYGLKIAVDESQEIEAAIGEVVSTALIGMGLAILVLAVFLRAWRPTFIAASAIPISIVATFSVMYFQGLSLNIMTLGGLALGTGMLVDNAIVVIENIFRLRQEGGPLSGSAPSAVTGTREVAEAIIASTLTTIVVFVPLVYVHGIAGILFKDQALTVVYSLLISLLVALALIPMLAARMGEVKFSASKKRGEAYDRFLAFSLRWRWRLLGLFIVTLALSWAMARLIPTEFFPPSVNGRMSMQIELPPGTSLEETEAAVSRIEAVLLKMRYRDARLAPLLQAWEQFGILQDWPRFLISAQSALLSLDKAGYDQGFIETVLKRLAPIPKDETPAQALRRVARIDKMLSPLIVVESVTSTVGTEPHGVEVADERIHGAHTARMDVVLNSQNLRELSATDVIGLLESEAARIPNLAVSFEARNSFLQELFGKNRGDIAIEVHAEELKDLQTAAADVADEYRKIPGLINPRTNLALGEEEYVLEPDYDALHRAGLEVADISTQIQNYLRGETTDPLKLDQGEMSVAVINPRALKSGIDGLMDLNIVSADQKHEVLKNLVTVRRERGVREIMRVNQERTLLAMVDLNGLRYDRAMEQIRTRLDAMKWPHGAGWNVSGEEVSRRDSFQKLFFALMVAIVLVYMTIASILESILHPLTIMLSVPFALTGVIGAFLLTGISLNLMGYIGIVMLVGIVVNNAIVLLDRIQQLRAAGEMDIQTAIVQATRQRVRPILMTSLTTMLGLAPLALGVGNGAELRRPMAIAIIGGMLSSTLLTLWLLPAFYLCVEDLKAAAIRSFGRRGKRRPNL